MKPESKTGCLTKKCLIVYSQITTFKKFLTVMKDNLKAKKKIIQMNNLMRRMDKIAENLIVGNYKTKIQIL